MARPPAEFLEASRPYVRVRVVNMAGVDLNVYRFDYDLTFAALLMNGDGTIYHRFGTRDHSSATSRLTMEAFVDLLRETLEDHALYEKAPSPPAPLPRRTIEGIPPMARKLQKKKIDCFHCHMVNDAERDLEREEGRYSREKVLGMWPLPDQVGFTVDPGKPSRVSGVVPGSAANRAGFEAGDRIHRMGSDRVRSEADIQWVLENASGDGARIPVEYERGGAPGKTSLILEKGWKTAGAAAFSWRSSMWRLRPRPGFGGRQLGKDELKKLGLEENAFAVKVGYIVDWGE
ncbi:MAG TPA: PDZ domain-containing protein, partial [Planctomycetota bacterium]|nr:PDZ domain-containing protein [Planctomycetota bacterium]